MTRQGIAMLTVGLFLVLFLFVFPGSRRGGRQAAYSPDRRAVQSRGTT